MKSSLLTPIVWLGCTALCAGARAQDAAPAPAAATPAPAPAALRPGELRFNFRGAPLETVLNYLSDAAGFVIVLDTPVRGTIDMWSTQPVSKDEAVQLLNIAINRAGYTAQLQGPRTLVISSKEDAKKRSLPIRTGNDPAEIPNTAEMVMQIIPLRRIDATQAARDLGTLLPGTTSITANVDSNSLVVTDTQINVRHIVELVAALDGSIDTVSTLRVFKLQNADPVEMAQLISSIYAPVAGRGGNVGGGGNGGFGGQGGFGGAGGFAGANPAAAAAAAGRGGFGGGGNGGGGRGGRGGAATSARNTPVVAVADPRTYSVIVTAAKETMADIAEVVAQLDSTDARRQKVFVYTLENADPKQVESVLKNLFQSTNQRAQTNNNQVDALQQRAQSNAQQGNNNAGRGTNTGARGGAGGRGN